MHLTRGWAVCLAYTYSEIWLMARALLHQSPPKIGHLCKRTLPPQAPCNLFICGTWLIHMWDMTHSCVGHDICVTWLIDERETMQSYVWHDSFICGTCLSDKCDVSHSNLCYDMTCSYVGHDSLTRATCLIHMCDVTHSYVGHVSVTSATCLIHMCGVTREHPEGTFAQEPFHLTPLLRERLTKVHCMLKGHLCTWSKSALYFGRALLNLVQRCPSKIQCTFESACFGRAPLHKNPSTIGLFCVQECPALTETYRALQK